MPHAGVFMVTGPQQLAFNSVVNDTDLAFVTLLLATLLLSQLRCFFLGAGHFPPGPDNCGRFPLGHFPRPDVSPCFWSAQDVPPSRPVTTYCQSQRQV